MSHRLVRVALVAITLFTWFTGSATADTPVPHRLEVQGVLRNAAGEVVSGTYQLTVGIWTAPSGGTLLRSVAQTVQVVGGVFRVSFDNLDNVFADHPATWLEIKVGNDPPLTRVPISSVAYAYQSEHAATADDLTGVLGIEKGGTGSSVKAFVDLSTDQTIGGSKRFMDRLGVRTITPGADLDVRGSYWLGRPAAMQDAGNTLGGDVSFVPGDLAAGATNGYLKLTYPDGNTVRFGTDYDGHLAGGHYRDIQFGRVNTPYLTIRDGGNVGIGVATPNAPLEVNGEIRSSAGGFRFPDGTLQTTAAGAGATYWAVAGTSLYNTNTGNVGIGTASPGAKLEVNGTAWIGRPTAMIDAGTTLGGRVNFVPSDLGPGQTNGYLALTWPDSSTVRIASDYDGHLGIGIFRDIQFGRINAPYVTLKDGGRVGIGTTTPYNLLHLYGVNAEGRFSGSRWENGGQATAQVDIFGDLHTARPSTVQFGAFNQDVNLAFVVDTQAQVEAGTSNRGLFISGANGYVGVNVPTPQRALHIRTNNTGTLTALAIENVELANGAGAVISFRAPTTGEGASDFVEMAGIQYICTDHNHATRSSRLALFSSHNGVLSQALTIGPNAYVGFGTVTPDHVIHVVRQDNAARVPLARWENPSNNTIQLDLFGDQHPNRGGWVQFGAWNRDVDVAIVADDKGPVEDGTTAQGIFLKGANGYVGIGTPTPQRRLDVAGTARFQGDVSVGGRISGGLLPPNQIRNSYMNLTTNGVPSGFSKLNWGTVNVTLASVHPFTKGFEGPYTYDPPACTAKTVDEATESCPYWFGRWYKGPRASRGGLADGWHSLSDGRILKITGNNSGDHTAVVFPFEQNVLTNAVRFKAFVKITKGSRISFGVDAGYLNVMRGYILSKAETDASPTGDGWYQIDTVIGLSEVTSLDNLSFSMGLEGVNGGDFEVYLALPYVANIDNDTWNPSVSDVMARDGIISDPATGRIGIWRTNPAYTLDVGGTVRASGYVTGDILFTKNDIPLWRMFEDEDGLFIESVRTGKVYKLMMQEVEKP